MHHSVVASDTFVVAKVLHTILYGVYVLTMSHSLRWIVYEYDDHDHDHEELLEDSGDSAVLSCHCRDRGFGGRRAARWGARIRVDWMLVLLFTVFVLGTTHLGLGLSLTIRQVLSGNMLGGDDLRFINTMVECMTALLADAVLIYRCWVVYAKSHRIVLLPLLLWTSCLACPFFVTNCYDPVFPPAMGNNFAELWGNVSPLLYTTFTFFGCHVGTNIYASYAIVLKTWHGLNDSFKSSRRIRIISRVLVESGVLYTCISTLNLFAHCAVAAGYRAFLLPRDLLEATLFPVAAITVNLILVRIIQEWPSQPAAISKYHNTSRYA